MNQMMQELRARIGAAIHQPEILLRSDPSYSRDQQQFMKMPPPSAVREPTVRDVLLARIEETKNQLAVRTQLMEDLPSTVLDMPFARLYPLI